MVLFLFVVSVMAAHMSDVVFIVLSQPNPYHAGRARQFQINFMEQTKFLPLLCFVAAIFDLVHNVEAIF